MRVRSKRPDRAYAAIPNSLMRDTNLSIEARGLMALMMGYSDEWKFFRTHLMETAGIGRDKFQKLMRQLRDAGYVELVKVYDGDELSGSTYIIYDDPESREPENPALGEEGEGLKTRPPENPTAGESGSIRRPDSEEDQLKENQGGDLFGPLDDDAERANRPDPLLVLLLDVLSESDAQSWMDFRREIKKPLTKTAVKRHVQFLKAQPDAAACVDQSIRNGWRDLYEVKIPEKSKTTVAPITAAYERHRAIGDQLRADEDAAAAERKEFERLKAARRGGSNG